MRTVNSRSTGATRYATVLRSPRERSRQGYRSMTGTGVAPVYPANCPMYPLPCSIHTMTDEAFEREIERLRRDGWAV